MADEAQVTCANSDGTNPLINWACEAAGYAVGSQNQQCVDAGNAFVADLDAKTKDIVQNWQPLPTFDPGQIRGITISILSVIHQAQATLDQAGQLEISPDLRTQLQNETDELERHAIQAQQYNDAANAADAQGSTQVSAPNIKQWVINAMNASSNAMVTAYTVGCMQPWWIGALSAFQTAFDTAWGVVMSIVGAAVAIGGAALTAVEGAATLITGTSKFVTWLFKWWPLLGLAVVGGGGYLIYRKMSGRPPLPSFDEIFHRGESHAE